MSTGERQLNSNASGTVNGIGTESLDVIADQSAVNCKTTNESGPRQSSDILNTVTSNKTDNGLIASSTCTPQPAATFSVTTSVLTSPRSTPPSSNSTFSVTGAYSAATKPTPTIAPFLLSSSSSNSSSASSSGIDSPITLHSIGGGAHPGAAPIANSDSGAQKRPMNAFLIFCKRHRSVVKQKYPHLENRNITKILGEWWANIDAEQKQKYTELARQYKEAFMKANPNFKWYKTDFK